jgi:UDP-3-O-[3-hydroxymyristoyl] glucosamine N-acyltransferase
MNDNALFSVADLSNIVNGEILGDPETMILGLNRIEDAEEGQLSFYNDEKYHKYLKGLKAACLLTSKDFNQEINPEVVIVKVNDPYLAFVKVLKYLDSKKNRKKPGIHETAIIDSTANIDSSAYIGPNCYISENCIISKNVEIHSNVVLYENVKIYEGTKIHAGAVCCSDTKIGKNCIIHPGAVIGSDGFGYIEHEDGSYDKIPQLGNVIIEDDAEIGANTTIDRAVVGSTIIGKGVKIDNLCQIGHNVKIGENTGIAGQAGIAGSCVVGKRNRLGGQSGLAGHLETADDVTILAQSGVPKSISKKGIYFGSPAKERLKAFKIEAAMNILPDLLREIKQQKEK